MSSTDIEFAAKVAVACWFGEEGRITAAIRNERPLQRTTLDHWLARWRVARNVPLNQRGFLHQFIIDDASQILSRPARPSIVGELVGAYMDFLASHGLRPRRLTSLFSKLAFAYEPAVYVPYDSLVRGALRRLGHDIADHDYETYHDAFTIERRAVATKLGQKGIVPSATPVCGQIMDQSSSKSESPISS